MYAYVSWRYPCINIAGTHGGNWLGDAYSCGMLSWETLGNRSTCAYSAFPPMWVAPGGSLFCWGYLEIGGFCCCFPLHNHNHRTEYFLVVSPLKNPQPQPRRPLSPTNVAPRGPSKRKLIFQVPSHRCRLLVGGGNPGKKKKKKKQDRMGGGALEYFLRFPLKKNTTTASASPHKNNHHRSLIFGKHIYIYIYIKKTSKPRASVSHGSTQDFEALHAQISAKALGPSESSEAAEPGDLHLVKIVFRFPLLVLKGIDLTTRHILSIYFFTGDLQ